jgi:alkanesulfonate monooxygenase SsuD/methylene tetrahydromethanopterin reductase-like flavin-dependent oxidoreductase (luciferase family)
LGLRHEILYLVDLKILKILNSQPYPLEHKLTGARGNSTALVGTPETVAEALAAYYDLGATSLLIRGYDPLPDAVAYGRELIPRVRALVAERDAVGV